MGTRRYSKTEVAKRTLGHELTRRLEQVLAEQSASYQQRMTELRKNRRKLTLLNALIDALREEEDVD